MLGTRIPFCPFGPSGEGHGNCLEWPSVEAEAKATNETGYNGYVLDLEDLQGRRRR